MKIYYSKFLPKICFNHDEILSIHVIKSPDQQKIKYIDLLQDSKSFNSNT